MISLMLAMDENRVIGKDNQLPWHLPADLQYFKKVTMGHPIVMGRKTYESIGRLLPGRENIIITRNTSYQVKGAVMMHNVADIKEYADNCEKEVFVIGGSEIFSEILPETDKLYITHIHHTFEGDTYFPQIDSSQWRVSTSVKGIVDDENIYQHDFIILERL